MTRFSKPRQSWTPRGPKRARTAVQRRALPTARAHAVLRTPVGRQLAGPGGARHDGPPRGWPRDDLNEVVGDLEGPAVNVEDGFERGEPRNAVPSPAPQRAVDVHQIGRAHV